VPNATVRVATPPAQAGAAAKAGNGRVPTAAVPPPVKAAAAPRANHAASAPAAAAYVTPSGVRVQRYQPLFTPQPQHGMWQRLRRLLFGAAETW
jgi:hypothetical protein